MQLIIHTWQSPLGDITLGSHDDKLCLVLWCVSKNYDSTIKSLSKRLGAEVIAGRSSVIDMAIEQLTDFFAGKRKVFSIPTEISASQFQRQVYEQLLKIPYGQVASYGAVAKALGRPAGARAAAMACARNPIQIILPCHRVVASGGALGGYAAGPELKSTLLSIENHVTHSNSPNLKHLNEENYSYT